MLSSRPIIYAYLKKIIYHTNHNKIAERATAEGTVALGGI